MIQKIDQAVAFVRSRTALQPRVGLILGSGLGDVVEAIDVEAAIPYGEIPGAKASTVLGHSGRMIFGKTGELPVGLVDAVERALDPDPDARQASAEEFRNQLVAGLRPELALAA